ncbi:ATP-binding protein [Streptomyces sp. NPDC093225]|uniref:ATP-binding protein n=1 Tax=Streptomyces sp. NPDC093225 TaxID=3366034 RepID=UPI0037F308F3
MGFTPSEVPHHRELDFEPGHGGACRAGLAFARQALTDWQLTAQAGDALLVAAELLANAVKHAGGPTRMSVDHTDGLLRIAVTDPSPAPPHRRRHRPESIGGHGLFLVDHLATQWGTLPNGIGKTVWADLALPPQADP